MITNTQIAFVLYGAGLPLLFLVFCIVLTWTGKPDKGPDSLSAHIERFRQDMHRAYAAEKNGRRDEPPPPQAIPPAIP
ncbi:MAG TPA: hypothetical protein VMB73_01775 [Acetobacteraceae bacterium]|jgi:hypothetical protein|nr:hypothetical protein [Acetobacteraceae bacterium]